MSGRYELVDLMSDVATLSKDEPARSVVHIISNDRGFRVVKDGRMADALAFDEMLGQIVNLLHPKLGTAHYSMLTRDQHLADAARREARIAASQEQGTAS